MSFLHAVLAEGDHEGEVGLELLHLLADLLADGDDLPHGAVLEVLVGSHDAPEALLHELLGGVVPVALVGVLHHELLVVVVSLSGCLLTSTASVEKTLTDWGFTAPLHRLTRGVNTDVFHLGPKTLFNDLAGPIALYVGRVAIEKNIEAFLSMPWPGTKVIVGDGPSLPALREKYKDAIFAGVQKGQNLADHFRSADVFVFPSRTDTFGIVLIEAMACGLPIAGYPVTGPMDIVENQALGALSEDLGQAAMAALNAPSSRETRHNHLLTHYTWPLARDQFVDAQSKAMIPR